MVRAHEKFAARFVRSHTVISKNCDVAVRWLTFTPKICCGFTVGVNRIRSHLAYAFQGIANYRFPRYVVHCCLLYEARLVDWRRNRASFVAFLANR